MDTIFRWRYACKVTLLLVLACGLVKVYGQDLYDDYEPLPRHDRYSWELIEQVKGHTTQAVSKFDFKARMQHEPRLRITEERILDRIRDGMYIRCDTLQEWVGGIFERILAANDLPLEDPLILISCEPLARAVLYGIGVFELSVGMLAMVQNEDQLAFVISHELVHRINHHAADRTLEYYEASLRYAEHREFARVVKGKEKLGGLTEVQLEHCRRRRRYWQLETESDTIGLEYMIKAGYDPLESLNALAGMGCRFVDNDHSARVLLSQLFTADYPVKAYWFDRQLDLYNEPPGMEESFETDSILRHPDLDLRRGLVAEHLGVSLAGTDSILEMRPCSLIFEAVEGAFAVRRLDVGFYLALQMRLAYPDNSFLVSAITRTLLKLYQARYDHTPANNIYLYVNPYTIDYGAGLTNVNTFLLNLEKDEFLDIGYHFLNNPETFDPEKEEHYYLLHRICELTDREPIAARVKAMYEEKFPEGEYVREFK